MSDETLAGIGDVPRGKAVGARVTRFEDPRVLLGDARFVADLTLPRMVHAAFVRSPHAHARVASIDTSAASSAPGVVTVATAEELPTLPLEDASIHADLPKTPQPALAFDRVRWEGEAVAVVVAGSPAEAEDAAEQVAVEYEPLPAMLDIDSALADSAPLIHEFLDSNALITESHSYGDVEGAFASADHVFKRHAHTNRISGLPLETRGCLADYERSSENLTIWSSTQTVDLLRWMLSLVLDHPHQKIRAIAPDVGGGFGPKMSTYPEEVAVCALARNLGCPVRWIEDRRESMLTLNHSKEQAIDLELAVRSDGRILGMRARYRGDSGAYSFNSATALIEPQLASGLMPSLYDVQAYEYELTAVITNKCPVGPYRGVGWTAGHTTRETLIDEICRELDLDPAQVRRINMISSDKFPYRSATGLTYDSGSYQESLAMALESIGYEDFRAGQARRRKQGEHVGIGISPYVEPTAFGTEISQQSGYPYTSHDNSTVTVDPAGKVRVAVSFSSQGQGHRTVFAQLAADALGARIEDVEVVAGDTERAPFGLSTYASRGAVIGGGSLALAAADVRVKMLHVAARILDVSPIDLEVEDSTFTVKGSREAAVGFEDVAGAAYLDPDLRMEADPLLSSTRFYDPRPTFSNGCLIAVVEVDLETGGVKLTRFTAIEDCGTVLNPMIVDGQVRGAVTQGVGAALFEGLIYDEQDRLATDTLREYLIPTASDVPSIDVGHIETPSPVTVGGIKGMGESGMLATPAAISNAVLDAIAPYDPEMVEWPLTPERVLRIAGRLK